MQQDLWFAETSFFILQLFCILHYAKLLWESFYTFMVAYLKFFVKYGVNLKLKNHEYSDSLRH